MRDSERSAASAFVGSCNSTRILVSHLVESSNIFTPFPGEECALAFFEDMCHTIPLKMTFKLS